MLRLTSFNVWNTLKKLFLDTQHRSIEQHGRRRKSNRRAKRA